MYAFFLQWICVINLAVLYNVTFILGRGVFWELQNIFPIGWIVLDYTCDFLYLMDMFIRMHEGGITKNALSIKLR